MKTTLKAIRNHSPCESGWVKLLVDTFKKINPTREYKIEVLK